MRGGKLPDDFGWLPDFDDFEQWWRHPDYGFELFCEPYVEDLAKVLGTPPRRVRSDSVLLEVSLLGDKDLILRDIKRALSDVHLPEEYSSKARYQPSLDMKYIKPEKLRAARETFILTEKMKHKKVVRHTNHIPDYARPVFVRRPVEVVDRKTGERKVQYRLMKDIPKSADFDQWERTKLRKVSRHRRSTLDIFDNLKRGVFP